MNNKTYFNWSYGKDSALALYYLLQDPNYTIGKLVTSVNTHYNRVSMHGLPLDLLKAQTNAIGIPLQTIDLPEQPTMEDYERIMTKVVNSLKTEGFSHAVFGDIFLEDLKRYREDNLSKFKIKTLFPLWKKDTNHLINEFIDLGFKAVIVCANAKYFSEDFVGQTITKELIENLPKEVDVCGENGEFHTFCYDGPIFKTPIPFSIGEKVYREYNAPKTEDSVCNSAKRAFGFVIWY
ncbi:diphthine--ammonia ligase [Lacinutrix neustonica]|uniref:Diphthine--ammonia ligase n=1 Tax=Lacinutrix neustonica TaxID=2980107 RepID=A0A9E8MWZ7_9FLAO|nr:diphthine--ammonia ligase [Lacinutrix neustonica]WAC03178.1 diphthine--ammonia ligase [Lacinutrix neustonica]